MFFSYMNETHIYKHCKHNLTRQSYSKEVYKSYMDTLVHNMTKKPLPHVTYIESHNLVKTIVSVPRGLEKSVCHNIFKVL